MMARITQTEIDELVQFIVDHYDYKYSDYKYIYWILAQHAAYDTLMVIRNKRGDIVAVCRWNILQTGKDALILDIVIHPRYRRKSLMHRMLRKGLAMYPQVKYLIFERHDRGRDGEQVGYKKVSVKRLLSRRF